jgi:hypothetical protein
MAACFAKAACCFDCNGELQPTMSPALSGERAFSIMQPFPLEDTFAVPFAILSKIHAKVDIHLKGREIIDSRVRTPLAVVNFSDTPGAPQACRLAVAATATARHQVAAVRRRARLPDRARMPGFAADAPPPEAEV